MADVTQGAEQVADRGPFDVIVAGEVIGHLACPEALLSFAAAVLEPRGRLVITTPNPYAPWRVRAGQTGFVHENVDHVVLAFPSGIVELAERTGLELDWFTTVDGPPSSLGPAVAGARRVARRKLGLDPTEDTERRRSRDGASDHGSSGPGPRRPPVPWYFRYPSPWRVLTSGALGTRGRTGETAIYVLAAP